MQWEVPRGRGGEIEDLNKLHRVEGDEWRVQHYSSIPPLAHQNQQSTFRTRSLVFTSVQSIKA